MRLSILPSLSLLVSFLSFVSSKAIYDIHAFERLNLSDTFAIQGSKPVTNGKMMESGMKRLQPPRALARQIVEGKRRRASPMGVCDRVLRLWQMAEQKTDTAPLARRSASPDIPYVLNFLLPSIAADSACYCDLRPCGLINVVNADTSEFLGILIFLPAQGMSFCFCFVGHSLNDLRCSRSVCVHGCYRSGSCRIRLPSV